MATPAAYPITSDDVVNTFGLSYPITSDDIATALGIASAHHSDLLLNQSAIQTSVHTVTEGTYDVSGVTNYGYDGVLNPYGSISPTTLDGEVINVALWSSSGNSFRISIVGNNTQSKFIRVNVQGVGWLDSSAATYVRDGEDTMGQWTWAVASASGWDGSGTRTITFEY